MESLKKQVAIVRRRLAVQRFLGWLVWGWFGALLVAVVAIGVQKLFLTEVDGTIWGAAWIGGAVVAGVLFAIVATVWSRSSDLEAAIELDRRFGLKERVSSSLALSEEEIQSPAGQALMNDAVHRVSRLEVGERFPVQLSRRAWLPLVPAIAAFVLCFLSDPTRQNPSQAQASSEVQAIKQSAKPLARQAEERKLEAEKKNLKDAADMLRKIEEAAREMSKKDEGDRREALAKLNDLAKQVEKRREALSQGEKLKDHLSQMKELPKGPAEKLANAMKNGDFEKALKELENLKGQFAQGNMSAAQQKEFALQMQAMRSAMQKIAESHKKARENLQKQLEQAQQNQDQEAAEKLQEQLDKLGLQIPVMEMLEQMAMELGQCSQCLQEGDTEGAQAMLNEMANRMARLQRESEEMQMMDAAAMEMMQMKAAMMCQKCGGAGCKECAGGGGDSGSKGEGGWGKGGKGGRGGLEAGTGRGGIGDPEKTPTDSKLYGSRVRSEMGRGASVLTGEIRGPNAKGQVLEEIKAEVENGRTEASDPLTGQKLPRAQRDHVKQYFDAFREGK